MDGFSVAAERHVAGVLASMRAETIDHLPAEIRKRVLKEAQELTNKNVFGEGYKKDRHGEPQEQGLGSHANPTMQSIAAFKKYHRDDHDFQQNLDAMEARLKEVEADRKTKRKNADD